MIAGLSLGVLGTCAGLYLLRKFRIRQWGICKSHENLSGKCIIITGSTAGIGKATAEELAKRGATVVMACRDVNLAKQIIQKVKQSYPLAQMEVVHLDLSSLDSIRTCAGEILEKYPAIHVLINNAGVSLPPELKKKTQDGLELHFGVNHIGHFLLTNLLLDRLKASGPSRIVIVSSMLHESGSINFDDLQGEHSESSNARQHTSPAYCNSKLANALFGVSLAKRLKDSHVNVYTVCPGWVATSLFRYYPHPWYSYIFILPVAFLFMRPPSSGMQTVLHCAVCPETVNETGNFYRNVHQHQSEANLDEKLADHLWEVSEKIVAM